MRRQPPRRPPRRNRPRSRPRRRQSRTSRRRDARVTTEKAPVPDPRWYAIWTRSRHEQVVRTQLDEKGITAFLPTFVKLSRWKDRRKKIDVPLFPGYVFAR